MSLINHFFPGDALDISEVSMKTKASPPTALLPRRAGCSLLLDVKQQPGRAE